jgi:hypothetical protein
MGEVLVSMDVVLMSRKGTNVPWAAQMQMLVFKILVISVLNKLTEAGYF